MIPLKELKQQIRALLILIFFMITPFVCFGGYSGEKMKQENTQLYDPENILRTMEIVADWQLDNPVRFDIIFKNIEEQKIERVRMLWDGTIALRQSRDFYNKIINLPENWLKFITLNKEDASFCELPKGVQNSLIRIVDPSQILQIKMEDYSSLGWEQGTFYAGLFELTKITENPVYLEALLKICEANKYKLGPRIYNADDHCVGQVYLDLFKQFKDSKMIADVQMRFDWIMKYPAEQSIVIKDGKNRWTWCDALFMSPPVWTKLSAVTGNIEYLNYMNKEWWTTTDHLYDTKEHLFYRDARYFNRTERNGQKIFWSRGNGWVIAGLARIIEEMPLDYQDRNRFEKLFKEMAEKVSLLQQENGLWNSSLLDPESYPFPEISGSGFFCYALAWGVNNGLLEKEIYLPYIKKAWDGLSARIQENGKLGWIQLPGGSPDEVKSDHTASYGVGAFLLAGSEVFKLR